MAVPKRKQSKARRDKLSRKKKYQTFQRLETGCSCFDEMSSVRRTQGAPSGLWQVWLLQGRRSCQG